MRPRGATFERSAARGADRAISVEFARGTHMDFARLEQLRPVLVEIRIPGLGLGRQGEAGAAPADRERGTLKRTGSGDTFNRL